MISTKDMFRAVLPPILLTTTKKIWPTHTQSLEAPQSLFEGNDGLYKELLKQAKIYGEYGVGKSTVWARRMTPAHMICVDSNKDWLGRVRSALNDASAIDLEYVDIGEVGEWGRPIKYEKRRNFQAYTNYLWRSEKKPDTVLIDGPFRVCCFLTSLKYANEGCKIIFDDYEDRPRYHVVQEFIEKTDSCGRQALFIVPNKISLDLEAIDRAICEFQMVLS